MSQSRAKAERKQRAAEAPAEAEAKFDTLLESTHRDAEQLSAEAFENRCDMLRQGIAECYIGFEKLNVGVPDDQPHYGPDPLAEMNAKIDAIITLLVARGVLDPRMITIEVLMRWLRTMREGLHGASEDRRASKLWRPSA